MALIHTPPVMPRPLFADPKTDFVFKRVFGSEEHKHILIAFLNHLLELDHKHRIVEVKLLDLEQRPPIAELKHSIVDVKCKDAKGTSYVVEMQVLNVEGFEKRVVYNVAKAYTSQLSKSAKYPKLNDVVGITICDFELWPNSSHLHIPMLSRWRMQEQHGGALGLSQIQFVFLELPKYKAGDQPKTLVDKWAYFFREAENLELIPEALSAEPYINALEVARAAGFSESEWDAYIRAGIALQDERGALSLAQKQGELKGERRGHAKGKREGLEEGKREGLEEGLRSAVKAICAVLDIGLSEAQQKKLERCPAKELEALLAYLQSKKQWPEA